MKLSQENTRFYNLLLFDNELTVVRDLGPM